MKASNKVSASPNRRAIKASYVGLGGNEINMDRKAIVALSQALRSAFDILEEMDDETFQALGDGESLYADLEVYTHELADTLGMIDGLDMI